MNTKPSQPLLTKTYMERLAHNMKVQVDPAQDKDLAEIGNAYNNFVATALVEVPYGEFKKKGIFQGHKVDVYEVTIHAQHRKKCKVKDRICTVPPFIHYRTIAAHSGMGFSCIGFDSDTKALTIETSQLRLTQYYINQPAKVSIEDKKDVLTKGENSISFFSQDCADTHLSDWGKRIIFHILYDKNRSIKEKGEISLSDLIAKLNLHTEQLQELSIKRNH